MKPINQLHNSMLFLVLFNLNFWGCFSMQNFAVSCHHKISTPILCFILLTHDCIIINFKIAKYKCSYHDIKMQTFSPPCKKKPVVLIIVSTYIFSLDNVSTEDPEDVDEFHKGEGGEES